MLKSWWSRNLMTTLICCLHHGHELYLFNETLLSLNFNEDGPSNYNWHDQASRTNFDWRSSVDQKGIGPKSLHPKRIDKTCPRLSQTFGQNDQDFSFRELDCHCVFAYHWPRSPGSKMPKWDSKPTASSARPEGLYCFPHLRWWLSASSTLSSRRGMELEKESVRLAISRRVS